MSGSDAKIGSPIDDITFQIDPTVGMVAAQLAFQQTMTHAILVVVQEILGSELVMTAIMALGRLILSMAFGEKY